MSASTDYSLLSALERELGRERVRSMAQAYMAATAPLLANLTLSPVFGPVPGGTPLSSPSFSGAAGGSVPPLLPGPFPLARTGSENGWMAPPALGPSASGPGWMAPPALGPSASGPGWMAPPALGPSASGPGWMAPPPVPVTPPPRLAAAPSEPPGAPARPAHSRGGLGLMRAAAAEEPADELDELRRTDPENPLLCPRHRPVPLGPSRNSSGNWGFYGPPPSSGCSHCQADDREDEFRNAMWAALARAEHERTVETVQAVEAAMAAFDAEGYRSCDRTYVARGLEKARAGI